MDWQLTNNKQDVAHLGLVDTGRRHDFPRIGGMRENGVDVARTAKKEIYNEAKASVRASDPGTGGCNCQEIKGRQSAAKKGRGQNRDQEA